MNDVNEVREAGARPACSPASSSGQAKPSSPTELGRGERGDRAQLARPARLSSKPGPICRMMIAAVWQRQQRGPSLCSIVERAAGPLIPAVRLGQAAPAVATLIARQAKTRRKSGDPPDRDVLPYENKGRQRGAVHRARPRSSPSCVGVRKHVCACGRMYACAHVRMYYACYVCVLYPMHVCPM